MNTINSHRGAKGLVGVMFALMVAGNAMVASAVADDPSFRGFLPPDSSGTTSRTQPAQPMAAVPMNARAVQPTQPAAEGTHFFTIERLQGHRLAFADVNTATYYVNAYRAQGITAQLNQYYYIDAQGKVHVTQLVDYWVWERSQQTPNAQQAAYLAQQDRANSPYNGGYQVRVVHWYKPPVSSFALFSSDLNPAWQTWVEAW